MSFRTGLAVCALMLVAGCGGGSGPAPVASSPASPLDLGQTAPVAPNSSLFVPEKLSDVPTRLDFGAGVPPGETFTYLGALPPGTAMPATYVDGVVFTVGPNPMPVSAITDLAVNFGASTPSQPLAAFLYEQATHPVPSADVPLAVAPSTQFQTANPPTSTPLTTLRPATTYFIFVGKT
jgi:hypothetical protein